MTVNIGTLLIRTDRRDLVRYKSVAKSPCGFLDISLQKFSSEGVAACLGVLLLSLKIADVLLKKIVLFMLQRHVSLVFTAFEHWVHRLRFIHQ